MAGILSDRDIQRIARAVQSFERNGPSTMRGPSRDPRTRSGGGGIVYAQAPSGGIPARSGLVPGSAVCNRLTFHTTTGAFVLDGTATITVKNWSFDIAAVDGDRILQATVYGDEIHLVGWSCTNTASAASVVVEGA